MLENPQNPCEAHPFFGEQSASAEGELALGLSPPKMATGSNGKVCLAWTMEVTPVVSLEPVLSDWYFGIPTISTMQ